MLRFLLAISLFVAACTPAAPSLPSSSAALPASISPTVVVTLAPQVTPVPSIAGVTSAPAPYGSDPYYDPDDKYTPRPVTPRPPPNADGVAVGTSPDGTYLVDEDGMSLYTFDNDSPGQSACSGDCADAWPPLAGERPLTQLEGVEGDLSIIERDDGSAQVAYNDRPLYYYAGDRDRGDTNGQGIGDVWFLAEP